MTIEFYDGTDHDGLFDVLGKIFNAQSLVHAATGTTVHNGINAILTQAQTLSDSLNLNVSNALASATTADVSFAAGGNGAVSLLQQAASALLVQIVNADSPQADPSELTAIKELIRQMLAESESVDASTVSASVAAVGSPTGDGVILSTMKSGDGNACELAIAEAINVTCVAAGNRSSLQFVASAAANILDAAWPDGSGTNAALTALQGTDGILSNGEFDAETEYTNIPDDWIVITGTAGSTILMTDVEVQTIAIAGGPTGGYYLLHWANRAGHVQTTAPIPFDADAGTVSSALQELTGLDGVTVESSGTEPNYTHTITFAEMGGNVAQFTSTNRMTGATTTVNEIQRITITGNPDGGTFTLTYAGQTTASIAYNASASTIATALVALSNIDAMTGTNGPLPNATADMQFGGSLASTDVSPMTIDTSSLTKTAPSVTVTTTTAGGAGGVNEVQTISADGVPNGGTWTITWSGQTTSALASTANAAAVQAALEALSNIGAGDVAVTGGTLGVADFVVTFQNGLASANQPTMTVDDSSLLGPNVTVSIATITAGSPTQNEVQQFQLYGTPTGGTFTLTYAGQTTSTIAYNASNATIDAALEALSNIGAGDVTIGGGPLPGSAVTVTFGNAMAATNVTEMTINGASLTGGAIGLTMSTPTPGVPEFSSNHTAYWKLDEASGTRYSSVGSFDLTENPGTIGSTAGKIGNAASLVTTGVLENYNDNLVNANRNFTVAGWFYLTQLAHDEDLIAASAEGTYSWTLTYKAVPGQFCFAVYDASSGVPTEVLASTFGTPSINTWHFLSASFNAATGQLRISVNAGTENTATLSGTAQGNGTAGANRIFLGDYYGSGFNADELGIWDLVFTTAKNTALYNAGAGRTSPFTGTNEVQRITIAGTPAQGSFTLTYAGQTTAAIAYDATASVVDAALEALSNIGAGDVTCSGGPLPGTPIDITFTGALAATDVAAVTANDNLLKVSITTTTQGNAGTNEVQRVSASPTPVAGTFTLTYSGQTTTPLDFDATAAEVDAALEALSNIGAGDVTCTGGPINTANITVTFTNALAATNVAEMTATSSLTGASPTEVTVATTTEGVSPSNETQSFTLGPDVTGGTYTLTWNNGASSQTTAAIAWNADAATVRTALEATSTIAPGDVATGGGPSPAAVTVTFQGAYAGLNVNAMTGSGSGLTQNAIAGTITTIQDGSPDSGSITHLTTVSGTPQVYSGAKALIFASNGSELTTIQQRLTNLQPNTVYGVHLWVCADAVPAAGVLKIELIDGTSGNVINDDQGTANALTFSASSLLTTWQSLDTLVSGDVVFRTPLNVPSIVYLRLRISTAVTSGRSIFLDRLTMAPMTQLYAGGPFVQVVAGRDSFAVNDKFMLTVANDRAGLVQEWFARNFNMAQLGMLLPSNSAGAETIPDSVVS